MSAKGKAKSGGTNKRGRSTSTSSGSASTATSAPVAPPAAGSGSGSRRSSRARKAVLSYSDEDHIHAMQINEEDDDEAIAPPPPTKRRRVAGAKTGAKAKAGGKAGSKSAPTPAPATAPAVASSSSSGGGKAKGKASAGAWKADPAIHGRSVLEARFSDDDDRIAQSPPVRDRKDATFKFSTCEGGEAAAAIATFRPNRSPEEVLRAGAFGGTYFRNIYSSVTKTQYTKAYSDLPHQWIQGLTPSSHLARSWKGYSTEVNKYKAKCGQTLEDWEGSGWITNHDPYGWFQWYCRFFQGRRCDDDERQISRWNKCCGVKGRWKSNLIGKVLIAGKAYDDVSVSPVVRQTLLHWAFELTEAEFNKGAKRVKSKGAAYVPKQQMAAVMNK